MRTELLCWFFGISLTCSLLVLLLWACWFFRQWHCLEAVVELFQNEDRPSCAETGDAEPVHILCTMDVQETRESRLICDLQQILSRAAWRESEAVRGKQEVMELLSDLSHQLKTPLANIILDIELLEAAMAVNETQKTDRTQKHSQTGSTDQTNDMYQNNDAQQTNDTRQTDGIQRTDGIRQTNDMYQTDNMRQNENIPELPIMDNTQIQTFLSHAKTQAYTMQWLMQCLLKASRLENGIIQFQPENTCIKPTIAKAVGTVYAQASRKHMEICVEDADNIPLYHNPKWTAEAMANVLENAVKYAPAGSRITIRMMKMDIYTRITIQDQGPGIPETEYNKIFQRFYRGKQAGLADGTGLGLYLAQLIAQSEQGYLTVESKPGQGSLFHFFLLNQKETN